MHIFEYILIMLVAVLASSFVGARFPRLPTPLVQIVAGVALTLLPLDFAVHLEPELFMVLFIAPLLFDDAKRMDKKALWRFKFPVLVLALGLVICTVLAVGFAVNLFTPSIPLAAAFALGAALAPTDAVAVHSIKHNAKISHEQDKLLQGESLLNDASSIVSFNFAVAAAITGAFSLLEAEGSFLFMFLGGLVLGVVLMLVRFALLQYLRSRGIDSVSFYVLFEVVTPLLVYLLAEVLGVSGIIAVVAAGIAHSFAPRMVTPSYARLGVVSTSVWSVISFTLNGLVFLMLGTQLPYVTQRVWTGTGANTNYLVIFVVLIFVVITVLRFVWILIMRRNVNLGKADEETFAEEAEPTPFEDMDEEAEGILASGFGEMSDTEREEAVEQLVTAGRQQSQNERVERRAARKRERRANKQAARTDKNYWRLHLFDALVLSLAGVKGALTLAIILSVPLTLDGTLPFPERDLLIFLASGVILLSLLVANIVLPLVSPKKRQACYDADEMNAILDIYRKVIRTLDEESLPSNRVVTGQVIQEYYARISLLKQNNSLELPYEASVRRYAIEEQLERAHSLVDEGRVSDVNALLYINSLSRQLARAEHHNSFRWELKALWGHLTHRFKQWRAGQTRQNKNVEHFETQALQAECCSYAIEKLRTHEPTEELPAHTVAMVRAEMEQRLLRLQSRLGRNDVTQELRRSERDRLAVEAQALDLEREAISDAQNEGLISDETAKLLRDNVAIMELDIEDQLD